MGKGSEQTFLQRHRFGEGVWKSEGSYAGGGNGKSTDLAVLQKVKT